MFSSFSQIYQAQMQYLRVSGHRQICDFVNSKHYASLVGPQSGTRPKQMVI